MCLKHIAASRKGMERKRRENIHGNCSCVPTFEPWLATPLDSQLVIQHEVMLTLCLCIYLNAVKQQITLQKISPVEGDLELFFAGAKNLKLCRWPDRPT